MEINQTTILSQPTAARESFVMMFSCYKYFDTSSFCVLFLRPNFQPERKKQQKSRIVLLLSFSTAICQLTNRPTNQQTTVAIVPVHCQFVTLLYQQRRQNLLSSQTGEIDGLARKVFSPLVWPPELLFPIINLVVVAVSAMK